MDMRNATITLLNQADQKLAEVRELLDLAWGGESGVTFRQENSKAFSWLADGSCLIERGTKKIEKAIKDLKKTTT